MASRQDRQESISYFVGLAADFDGTIANHGFVNVDAAT
jgi:hypothetical protein